MTGEQNVDWRNRTADPVTGMKPLLSVLQGTAFCHLTVCTDVLMQCHAAVLFEKSTIPQTGKKLTTFLEPNIHYHIHNSPPLHINPVHTSSYHLILYYCLGRSLPSGPSLTYPHQKRAWNPVIYTCYMPRLSNYIYLHTQSTFPVQYTHTCQQLYLKMNRVMWLTVTSIHQKAVLNSQTVLHLCTSKDIRYIWKKYQKFYFKPQDYKAADLCITRKKGLLYCCWYCWYCYTAILLLVLLILLYCCTAAGTADFAIPPAPK